MQTSPNHEISPHQVRVYLAAKAAMPPEDWLTTTEIAARTKVARRTVSLHCSRMVEQGVFEVRELFLGYRYRLAKKVGKEELTHVKSLEEAAKIFGLS
jgi:DNA-binding MarR family transcriptional regulator